MDVASTLILDITDGKGRFDEFALFSLFAVMAHPRKAEARNQLLAVMKADVGGALQKVVFGGLPWSDEEVRMWIDATVGAWLRPHGGFATLVQTQSAAVYDRARNTEWPGTVAGEILLRILQLSKFAPPASVHKAIFLLERDVQHIPEVAKSERPLRAAWQEYKPAAHLWAAWRIWCRGVSEGEHSESLALISEELLNDLPRFLAVAEILRRFGIEHRPSGRTDSTLLASETWQLPADLKLPATCLTIPPLEEQAAKALQDYRAPKRFI